VGLFIASTLLRPTIAGDLISFVGSLGVLVAGVVGLSVLRLDREALRMAAFTQGSAILLWSFLMSHAAINGVPNFYAGSAFLQIATCCAGAMICLSNRRVHDLFFSFWRLFLAAFAASFVMTTALSMSVGLETLHIASLQTPHYENYDVYFPITISYDVKDYFGTRIVRASAWFREAGIAQAFYASAILTMPKIRTARQWALALLLFTGGIATQSTIGLAIVGIAAAAQLFRNFRDPWFRVVIAVPAVYLAVIATNLAISDETVGLASKIDTESYIDRATQVEDGLRLFFENPLGYGAYSAVAGGGINLISMLGAIGIFGAMLVLLNLTAAIAFARDRIEKAVYVLPLFVTSLTSQPLIDAALMYVFLGYAGSASALASARNAPASVALPWRGRKIGETTGSVL